MDRSFKGTKHNPKIIYYPRGIYFPTIKGLSPTLKIFILNERRWIAGLPIAPRKHEDTRRGLNSFPFTSTITDAFIPPRPEALVLSEYLCPFRKPIVVLLFDNLDVAERREREVTGTSTHRRQNTTYKRARGTCTGTRGVRVLRVRGDRGIDARERWFCFRVDGQSPLTSPFVCTHRFLRPTVYYGIAIKRTCV